LNFLKATQEMSFTDWQKVDMLESCGLPRMSFRLSLVLLCSQSQPSALKCGDYQQKGTWREWVLRSVEALISPHESFISPLSKRALTCVDGKSKNKCTLSRTDHILLVVICLLTATEPCWEMWQNRHLFCDARNSNLFFYSLNNGGWLDNF
jgi:hypothetical protein